MNLQEVYERWIERKRRQVKPTTLAAYATCWRVGISERWGAVALDCLRSEDVRRWAYSLQDSGMEIATLRGRLALLKMVARFGSEELGGGYVDTQWRVAYPTANKKPRRRVETYGREESKLAVLAARAVADSDGRAVGLLVAFATGMRIGEVLGLRVDDVDLSEKIITVRRTVSEMYDAAAHCMRRETGLPKTASGERRIPILPGLLPVLRRAIRRMSGGVYVTSGTASPGSVRSFRDWYKRFMRRAGVARPLKFHCIRHTFATRLIEAGADVKTVAALMGHANVSTTLNLYVHPTDEQKRRAVDKTLTFLLTTK